MVCTLEKTNNEQPRTASERGIMGSEEQEEGVGRIRNRAAMHQSLHWDSHACGACLEDESCKASSRCTAANSSAINVSFF
jgi:hypothetical protein